MIGPLAIGDPLTLQVPMSEMLNIMIENYNTMDYGPEIKTKVKSSTFTSFSCKVAGFLDGSYGKYPKNSNQLIMEYGNFT